MRQRIAVDINDDEHVKDCAFSDASKQQREHFTVSRKRRNALDSLIAAISDGKPPGVLCTPTAK